MKALLIKPRVPSDTIIPPIGLGYLAKVVTPRHTVKILDCLMHDISENKLADYIRNYRPELVGVQVYNIDKSVARRYLKIVKRINDSIITVVGGPYPSCEPGNVFNFFGECLDFAFHGEAETGFAGLLDKISNDKSIDFVNIEGLIWVNNGNLVMNNPYFIKNLDNIGAPEWSLLAPEAYPPAPVGAFLRDYPVAPINVSRGCPYNCSFCAGWKITGHFVRYRSIENVINEIEILYKKYGIREIHILDDNFTYNKEYVRGFCNSLLKTGISIKLACPNGVRINTLDRNLLELMKEAGFYAVHLGIESGSQKVLNYMGKALSVELIKEKINIIKKAGMSICGYFIIGYPGESVRDLESTIKFSLELPLSRAMFMNFLPIPGTRIFELLQKKNKLNKLNLSKNNFYTVNYKPDLMSPAMLKILQLKAFLLFYLRPKIIFENIKDIYNFKHLLYLIKRIFRILVNV